MFVILLSPLEQFGLTYIICRTFFEWNLNFLSFSQDFLRDFFFTDFLVEICNDGILFFTNHELQIILLTFFIFFIIFSYEDFFFGIYSFSNFFISKLRSFMQSIFFGILGYSVDFFFFRYIWNIFFLILCINFSGLVPYVYTLTSQAIDSISLGFLSFAALNIFGFYKWGVSLGSLLLPQGAPLAMAPLLVPVEFLSYISRSVSLGVRLFANIMAGHTLLKIFSGIVYLILFDFFFAFIGFIFLCLITILETAVAFLQAYVFSMLFTVYVNDVLVGSH